jgi:hypothetical protein
MERYKRFLEWTRTLAVFSAVFAADLVLKRVEDQGFSLLATTFILGLVAIVSLHVAEAVAVRVIEAAPWLRRLVLANQWVEGIWIDEVVGENHFALVTMSTEGGEVKVRGEQFDVDGAITATWESCASVLEGNTLRTIYRSPQFYKGQPSETSGMSTYVFTGRPGQAPEFYSGSFIDAAAGGRNCQLRGARINDRKLIGRLMSDVSRRAELINLAQTHMSLPKAHVQKHIAAKT